ncbi:MAG: CDP-alcohol phosphatidyltransferase family protein [Thaumarchaeota archaeon]|nr:CDP-alcohol phosphatidyltransferase family protein [Nitrososphaerota archaeon]
MLDRLRGRLKTYFWEIGKAFATLGLSPTGWTSVGLVVSFICAAAYWTAGQRGELTAGLLILLAGFLDIVDGAVARFTERMSKRGAFLDSTLDRVSEVAIFLGILAGGLASPVAVVLALSFSLLVSYSRARGESLGTSLSGVGIGERSERLLVLAVSSILGLVGWGVVLVAVLALFTFLERTARGAMSLK